MKEPVFPQNERARIKELHELHILDSPIENSFERITRLAQKLFEVPIVGISLVDSNRQWFKSLQGLDVKETPRSISFCGHTILNHKVMVVNNALDDERFYDNPLVTGQPNIRFYAGCPISTLNDNHLGTLCLIDSKQREFTEEEAGCLVDLTAFVEKEINNYLLNSENMSLQSQVLSLEKISAVDPLTQLWNRNGLKQNYKTISSNALRKKKQFALCLIDIDNFKEINDAFGHEIGDMVIKEISRTLVSSVRTNDTASRWGGDEFVILLDTDNFDKIKIIAERIHDNIEKLILRANNKPLSTTVTIGAALYDNKHPKNLEQLISEADKRLYEGKKAGKNGIVYDFIKD